MSSDWERLKLLRSHANRLQNNVGYVGLDEIEVQRSKAGTDHDHLMFLENGLREIMRRNDIDALLNESSDFLTTDYTQRLEGLCDFLDHSVNVALLQRHEPLDSPKIHGRHNLDALLNILSRTDWRFVMVTGPEPKLFVPQLLEDGQNHVDAFNSSFNLLTRIAISTSLDSIKDPTVDQLNGSTPYDGYFSALQGVTTLLSWSKRRHENCQGCKVFLQSPEWDASSPSSGVRTSRLRLLLHTCRVDTSNRFQECWFHNLAKVDRNAWVTARGLCDQIHETRDTFSKLRLAASEDNIYVYTCDDDQDPEGYSDDEYSFDFHLKPPQEAEPKTLEKLIDDGVFLPPGLLSLRKGPRFDEKTKRAIAAVLVSSLGFSLTSQYTIQSWDPKAVYLPINSTQKPKKPSTCLPFILCLERPRQPSTETQSGEPQPRPSEANIAEERQLQLAKLLLDIEGGFRRQLTLRKEELEALILDARMGEGPDGPRTGYLTAILGCLNLQKSCQLHARRLRASGADQNSFTTAMRLTCSEIIRNIMKEREPLEQVRQKRRRESDKSHGRKRPLVKWEDEEKTCKLARDVPGITALTAEVDRCELFGPEIAQDPESKDSKDANTWINRFCELARKHRFGWGGRRLTVAVLDSGVDGNHPEIRGHLLPGGRILRCKSFIGGSATEDSCGHGTHIAGILLDLAPNVDLYIVKITNSRFCDGRIQIVEALQHARQTWEKQDEGLQRVDMISLSFGFNNTEKPDTVREEIKRCIDQGIVVFASASNDGARRSRTYPGGYDGVLCIHSARGDGRKSDFNPIPEPAQKKMDNFMILGDCVQSYWPVALIKDPVVKSIRYMSGTSFATPIAVSFAAFMIGWISKKMHGYKFEVSPCSPGGMLRIFREVTGGRLSDGYDLIEPCWYFNKFKEDEIIAKMKRILDE